MGHTAAHTVYYLSSANLCFPDSSAGKESSCNAGGPGSIPGSGRSAGEGVGYPLQYSQASLVAQLVKNPPPVRKTWVRNLGWEDPLEGRAWQPTPVFLTEEFHGLYSLWCCKEPDTTFSFTFSQFNEEKLETCSNLKFLLLVWFKI